MYILKNLRITDYSQPNMGMLKSVISQLLKILAQFFLTYTPIFGV